MNKITTEEKQQFDEQGFIGPLKVLNKRECEGFLKVAYDPYHPPPIDWSAGCAASSRAYYKIAMHPEILERVEGLIGEDIMLWGASIKKQTANKTHPWHSDIESASAKGKTVSVWIGLKGVDQRSSLAYVSYSHAFGFTVQEVRAKHNKSRHKTTSDDIAQWAKEQDERSTPIVPEMGGGDALFFNGNIWHGTQNKNQEIRFALLLQYATPESAIRIPNLNYLDWPFKQFNQPRPACIMLRGSDHYGVNRIVSAPISNNGGTKLQLTNRIYPLDLPLTPDAQKGWKPYPIFHGSTGNINDMSCHISVLNQHKCPHEPHNHKEEELLILLKGEGTMLL